MGIDASIALGIKPVQIDSPMNSLAQMLQIQQAQQSNQLNRMKMDEYQRTADQTNRLNSLYSGAIGPDGKIDRAKLLSDAASQNLGSKIPGMQKGFLETDEAQGKIDKQRVDLIDAKLKQSRSFLDSVRTPEDYLAWHEANHADPILGPVLAARGVTEDSSRASILSALQQPGGFQELLNKSAMGLDKFAEMNKPTVHVQNLGGTSQVISIPGMGGTPTVLSNSEITQSPDNLASQQTKIRGQNMIDARARAWQEQSAAQHEAIMSKPFEVTGADGSPVLVQQDKQGNIKPVTGYSPKSAADKPLTDAQSKAVLFGSRMQAANDVLASLEKDGTTTSIPGSRSGFGIGALLNTVSTAKQQQLDQAKRDFVNAVLRRESGAAISASEFDNAEKQYFPQIGDSKEVISQKSNNRALAIRGMQAEVPKSQRSIFNEIQGGNTAPSSPTYTGPKPGWTLHMDANGNRAYVSPDGKQFVEVK
jgi:hypothetical protein